VWGEEGTAPAIAREGKMHHRLPRYDAGRIGASHNLGRLEGRRAQHHTAQVSCLMANSVRNMKAVDIEEMIFDYGKLYML